MISLPVHLAGARLQQLIMSATESHEPVQITGPDANAVLLPEEDWRSIQETLHLLSVPGMRESILSGMAEPLSETSTDAGW